MFRTRAAVHLVSALLAVRAVSGESVPEFNPGRVAHEKSLEYRWSHGIGWSLFPSPNVPLTLRVRLREDFDLHAIESPGKRVHVVWLPHAAGSATGSELAARLVTDRGWGVTALVPSPDLPLPGASVEDWVVLLERRIRAAHSALSDIDADGRTCVAVIGVSAGGIAALRAAADAERVDVVVAMLAGGGVEGFAHAARAYGASHAPLNPGILRRLRRLDPAATGHSLRGKHVVLVRASLDRVVRKSAFEELARALDEPEVHAYPTGHESFSYVMPWALRRALDSVERDCQARRSH